MPDTAATVYATQRLALAPKYLITEPWLTNTPDLFIKLTDKQRHKFAQKLSEMPEMSKYSQGTESYQQFAIRIADMLLDDEKFKELYPILQKAGFNPND